MTDFTCEITKLLSEFWREISQHNEQVKKPTIVMMILRRNQMAILVKLGCTFTCVSFVKILIISRDKGSKNY